MKAEAILRELEAVKERLAIMAGGTQRFLDQMEAWLDAHPHAGPVVNAPEELQARLRLREAAEPAPPPAEPYRVYDPIIAEVHRIREQLARERDASGLVLKDAPPRKES